MAGKCRTVFELAGVEQSLVMTGQFYSVRTFFRDWLGIGNATIGTVPGMKGDDGPSM
jgi:hypothetical protein